MKKRGGWIILSILIVLGYWKEIIGILLIICRLIYNLFFIPAPLDPLNKPDLHLRSLDGSIDFYVIEEIIVPPEPGETWDDHIVGTGHIVINTRSFDIYIRTYEHLYESWHDFFIEGQKNPDTLRITCQCELWNADILVCEVMGSTITNMPKYLLFYKVRD